MIRCITQLAKEGTLKIRKNFGKMNVADENASNVKDCPVMHADIDLGFLSRGIVLYICECSSLVSGVTGQ